jgi:hypothetical protein
MNIRQGGGGGGGGACDELKAAPPPVSAGLAVHVLRDGEAHEALRHR